MNRITKGREILGYDVSTGKTYDLKTLKPIEKKINAIKVENTVKTNENAVKTEEK